MGIKMEKQISAGVYPSKSQFVDYYITNNHTIMETADNFKLTKNIVLNLISYYDVHKDVKSYIKNSSRAKIENNHYPSRDELIESFHQLGNWAAVGQQYRIPDATFKRLRFRLGLKHSPNQILKSKSLLVDYIHSFGHSPTGIEIANDLSVGLNQVYYWVEKFGLSNMLNQYGSFGEMQLKNSLVGYPFCKNRTLIKPLELDLYCKEKNVAIEFDGDYWHSDEFKDKYYHFNKSKRCDEKGVLLIHVYEHEFDNDRSKVISYIKSILSTDVIIEANNLKYSVNHANNNIDVVAINTTNNNIVNNMRFVFDSSNDVWEITEYHPELEYAVQGSNNRMFRLFIEKYCPKRLICKCNFNKDNGSVLQNIGMSFVSYIEPKKLTVLSHGYPLTIYDAGGKLYEYRGGDIHD